MKKTIRLNQEFEKQKEFRELFRRINSATNPCYKIYNTGEHIWYPLISVKDNGIYRSPLPDNKHINVIEDDLIYELLPNPDVTGEDKECRFVFARFIKDNKTSIKFLGKYQLIACDVVKDFTGTKNVYCKHKRISEDDITIDEKLLYNPKF